jgi:hypothetical protein
MNFNDLPNEIKLKIFHINKEEERKEKEMKKKFDIVIQDLKNIVGELPFYFDLSDYCEDCECENEEYISHFIIAYLQDLSYMIC